MFFGFLFLDKSQYAAHPNKKWSEELSAYGIIVSCKVVFAEYRLPEKVMWGVDTNFISENS